MSHPFNTLACLAPRRYTGWSVLKTSAQVAGSAAEDLVNPYFAPSIYELGMTPTQGHCVSPNNKI